MKPSAHPGTELLPEVTLGSTALWEIPPALLCWELQEQLLGLGVPQPREGEGRSRLEWAGTIPLHPNPQVWDHHVLLLLLPGNCVWTGLRCRGAVKLKKKLKKRKLPNDINLKSNT